MAGGHICLTYEDINRALSEAKMMLGVFSVPFEVKELSSDYPKPQHIAKVGEILLQASVILARKHGLSKQALLYGLPRIDTYKTAIREICPTFLKPVKCEMSKYRTLSGMCNNLDYPSWGSSRSAMLRFLPPDYSDGKCGDVSVSVYCPFQSFSLQVWPPLVVPSPVSHFRLLVSSPLCCTKMWVTMTTKLPTSSLLGVRCSITISLLPQCLEVSFSSLSWQTVFLLFIFVCFFHFFFISICNCSLLHSGTTVQQFPAVRLYFLVSISHFLLTPALTFNY